MFKTTENMFIICYFANDKEKKERVYNKICTCWKVKPTLDEMLYPLLGGVKRLSIHYCLKQYFSYCLVYGEKFERSVEMFYFLYIRNFEIR